MTRRNQGSSYIDGFERVTGRVPYVLNYSRPGMLHGAIHRSLYPHARIRRVDPQPALDVPGVTAVLTGDDISNNQNISPRFGPVIKDQPIVAIDKVHYVGDPIAVVAATDREIAKYAATLIEVDYEELPAALSIEEALADGAALVHELVDKRQESFPDVILRETAGTNYCNHFHLQHGDVEKGFAEADYVFEDTFTTPGAQHVPMETHVVIVEIGPDGAITVWSSTQTPYLVRAQLAELFHLSESRVRVVVPTLGGGYGAKTYPKLEPLTVALAMKAGAPVKIVIDRDEEFLTLRKHDSIITVKTGVKADGTLVGRQTELWWDAGAYADISPRYNMFGGFYAPGPYKIPHVKIISHAVYTNKPPSGAFRGFSGPQNAFAFESQMDMIAERLGIDPVEIRRKNLLGAGDTYATGETMRELHFQELLEDAAYAIGWRDREDAVVPSHRRRGKGVATMMMATITPSTSTATVKVNGDGSINVLSSTVEMGQGSRTALAQIAADAMTVALERVSIVDPDTNVTPFDLTTSASRSTFSMGGAVREASADAKQQLVKIASDELEAHPSDLVVRDGGVFVIGTDRGAPFSQLIKKSQSGTIVGRGTFRTQGGLDPSTGQGLASAQWHPVAASVEVEVDTETGEIDVLRLHTSTYTGKTINHRNAELQMEGSAIFGLGTTLLEEMVYDQGQLTNATLADYMIPSFVDVPPVLTTALLESSDPGAEPHGIGENAVGPIPAAIANAIYYAVGVRLKSLTITPEKILRALKANST